MDKEGNDLVGNFQGLDYNSMESNMNPHHNGSTSADQNSNQMVDCMMNNPLSFADVMQFADFGPKLGLNQSKSIGDEENEPFLKLQNHDHHHQNLVSQLDSENQDVEKMTIGLTDQGNKSKRKRTRSVKTSEEVESQRMTHIAVERNRRKQMNEHLRVLRSLMPTSYVQRGDQASIIGGAIEFVRELEQLLQCLESQKRRRIYGGSEGPQRPMEADPSSMAIQQHPQMAMFPSMPIQDDQIEYEAGIREETAESRSCLADVEVKLLGFDALIKILSRRRPGQLIKAIAALEDLQLNILHTNITSIEQTVLYSFNVKIGGEARFTAEDIANSVQQIFSFIHANSSI